MNGTLHMQPDGNTPYENLVHKDFPGKTAVVLGGASGIGLEIVRALYEQGAKVHVLGLTPVPDAIRSRGAEAISSYIAKETASIQKTMPDVMGKYRRFTPQFVECNVLDEATEDKLVVQNEIEKIGAQNNGISYLVDSIGWSPRTHFEKIKPREMIEVAAGNGAYVPFVLRSLVPFMQLTENPRAVFLQSTMPHNISDPKGLAYGYGKGGRTTLVTYFANRLGPLGIGISGTSPGHVRTTNEEKVLGGEADQVHAAAVARRPIAADLTARDVANQVLLQLTPHAQFYSGADFFIGASAGKNLPLREAQVVLRAGWNVEGSFNEAALEVLSRIEQNTGAASLELARENGRLQGELAAAHRRIEALVADMRRGGIHEMPHVPAAANINTRGADIARPTGTGD